MPFDLQKEVQDFGPYKLVIRQAPGAKAFAVLWRGGEKLASAEAGSKDEAYAELLRLLGERQLARAQAQGSEAPKSDQLVDSFRFLWSHLTRSQQGMLRAWFEAPGHELSVPALAEAVGFRHHGGVNLWLGLAGVMFAEECPRPESQVLRNRDGQQVATGWFGIWDESRGIWTMRADVAEGMRQAHMA